MSGNPSHAARGGRVARPPAYQLLADELRDQIASGQLRPGERLPTEPQMCARSGLSRSTVREALRLLASQQLIVTTRGVTGGSFVAEPSVARLGDSLSAAMQVLRAGMAVTGDQFLEARELLEVQIAQLAAERRDEADLVAMRCTVTDPAATEVEQRVTSYWTFRAAMTAAVHNPLLELLFWPLRQTLNEHELSASGPPDMWPRVAQDDRALLARIEAGDGAGAAAVTRRHLRYLRELYAEDEIRLGTTDI